MKLFSARIFILSGAASGKAQIESAPREIDEPTAIASLAQPRRDSLPNGTGEQMKLIILLILIVGGASAAQAQIATGGSYTLDQSVIASGGGTSRDATAALYAVNGTIGQPAAGATSTGGTYALNSGFQTAAPAAPTAAAVSISGRVITPQDFGLTNALVTLTDFQGNSRKVRTGKFGSYYFGNVEAGATYILTVTSKRYTYDAQIVTANADLREVNFTPLY